MISAYDLTLMVYNITIIPIIFFSVLFIILCFINIFFEKKEQRFKPLKNYPFVTVQIPTYNDPIGERCIQKCMEFDYPKDRYEIVIADDSTNVETQVLLKNISDQNPDFVKYIHRTNREGFKAGALNNAMKISKGEIMVIFDADFIPNRDFLIRIIQPFSDPKMAIVQTRQGFYNKDTNLITRFAAYTLMIHHTIVLPISNRINCVFFCGTAGAIRRKHFEDVGGWNHDTLCEDSELSLRLIKKGYKTVYLDSETPSEVPETLESIVRQQMRWCYANIKLFIDNAPNILFKKGLTLRQRAMVSYITLANLAAPFVVIMTVAGLAGWFLGDPKLFDVKDIITLLAKFLYTCGFLVIGIITLKKQNKLKEFKYFLASSLTVGIVIAVGNSFGFIKALFNSKPNWYCTPKIANQDSLK